MSERSSGSHGSNGSNGSRDSGGVETTTDENLPPRTAKRRSNIPSLVAALSASLTTGGTTYAFGLYGNDLKKSLSLTASEVDTISTAFFVAGLFSFLPGLSADKFGTRRSIATGGITGAIALLTYWAVAKRTIAVERSHLVPVLSGLGISIFLSCALITGSVFKIIVTCCGPGSKGSAVGAAKGFVGLGSGVYACIFRAIRVPQQSNLDFLPLAAFFAIVSATLPALCLLPSKVSVDRDVFRDDATPRHFRTLYWSLGVLAVLIVWSSLADLSHRHAHADNGSSSPDHPDDGNDNGHDPRSSRRQWPLAMLLVTVWLGPIASLLVHPRRQRLPGSDPCDENEDNNDDAVATIEGMDNENDKEVVVGAGTGGSGTVGVKDDLEAHRAARDGNRPHRGELPVRRGSPDFSPSRVGRSRSPATPEHLEDHNDNDPSSVAVAEGQSLLHLEQEPTSLTSFESHDGAEPHEQNSNLLQLLQTPSAWLLLWTTTVLVGAGTVETNNMGAMVESLGLPSSVTSSSLALFSVAQAAGRVATGAVSEAALDWKTNRFVAESGVPRPFFLFVASGFGALAHLVLGMATRQLFFVLGSTLAGVAFGMVWPLMVLIVGEVFGTQNTGANYMFYDGFSSAIGTLLLTKVLAQRVYESHAEEDASTCVGSACFQLTHLLAALLCLTCLLTSGALMFASRHTYNRRRRRRRRVHHRA